jgi:GNAT superfamily N-acetyltransferase
MNAVCDPLWAPEQRRARAELFARIRRPLAFATALDGPHPVSGAMCVIDREVAGLFSLRTAAAARGRGHGRAVVERLGAWARGMGATLLFLQIEEANAPALGLAQQLGFERRYDYWYRELPG